MTVSVTGSRFSGVLKNGGEQCNNISAGKFGRIHRHNKRGEVMHVWKPFVVLSRRMGGRATLRGRAAQHRAACAQAVDASPLKKAAVLFLFF